MIRGVNPKYLYPELRALLVANSQQKQSNPLPKSAENASNDRPDQNGANTAKPNTSTSINRTTPGAVNKQNPSGDPAVAKNVSFAGAQQPGAVSAGPSKTTPPGNSAEKTKLNGVESNVAATKSTQPGNRSPSSSDASKQSEVGSKPILSSSSPSGTGGKVLSGCPVLKASGCVFDTSAISSVEMPLGHPSGTSKQQPGGLPSEAETKAIITSSPPSGTAGKGISGCPVFKASGCVFDTLSISSVELPLGHPAIPKSFDLAAPNTAPPKSAGISPSTVEPDGLMGGKISGCPVFKVSEHSFDASADFTIPSTETISVPSTRSSRRASLAVTDLDFTQTKTSVNSSQTETDNAHPMDSLSRSRARSSRPASLVVNDMPATFGYFPSQTEALPRPPPKGILKSQPGSAKESPNNSPDLGSRLEHSASAEYPSLRRNRKLSSGSRRTSVVFLEPEAITSQWKEPSGDTPGPSARRSSQDQAEDATTSRSNGRRLSGSGSERLSPSISNPEAVTSGGDSPDLTGNLPVRGDLKPKVSSPSPSTKKEHPKDSVNQPLGHEGAAATASSKTREVTEKVSVRKSSAEPRSITADELRQHSSNNDCWIAYRGTVYNITTYLSHHPGGSRVLVSYGGKDATERITKQHGYVNVERLLGADRVVGVLAKSM
ncbi:hypothetical protein HK102_002890 [Quaeritorhiza haematococci]|nr:hypothetical protein HK102_002890 [Quaeritorhiza haematococci]